MKVFMCYRSGGYAGGLAVVAANSIEEAFDVFHHNGENEWMLYTENGIQESIYYKRDGWFEVPILSADTIVQKVIAEGGYTE